MRTRWRLRLSQSLGRDRLADQNALLRLSDVRARRSASRRPRAPEPLPLFPDPDEGLPNVADCLSARANAGPNEQAREPDRGTPTAQQFVELACQGPAVAAVVLPIQFRR
jgi:hypothetical protein